MIRVRPQEAFPCDIIEQLTYEREASSNCYCGNSLKINPNSGASLESNDWLFVFFCHPRSESNFDLRSRSEIAQDEEKNVVTWRLSLNPRSKTFGNLLDIPLPQAMFYTRILRECLSPRKFCDRDYEVSVVLHRISIIFTFFFIFANYFLFPLIFCCGNSRVNFVTIRLNEVKWDI